MLNNLQMLLPSLAVVLMEDGDDIISSQLLLGGKRVLEGGNAFLQVEESTHDHETETRDERETRILLLLQ